ncbi:hypothetical protein STEG23_008604, partial [Scotinomys teguina]
MKRDFSFDAISMKLSSFSVCILWRSKERKDEKKTLGRAAHWSEAVCTPGVTALSAKGV